MSTAVTPPPTGITVQRALELPGLRSGLPEVVACAERLGRTVRWVHAGEVPNIASLLKGGELLLTTGYGLGTRPADQRAFVRTLAERGIAALVVELGPRFSRLPAALVDAARAAGLPLVQLHREVPFVTVTEEIHTEIVNGHYALLQRAEEVHRRCTEALLGGGGVPQVLEILAGFTGNPVFLETTDGQLLYAAGEGPEGADPLQVWEGLRDRQRDDPPGGTVLVDVPGGGPGSGGVRARLVLLPVRSAPEPVHRMAAERAAGILALVLMQARQEEELAARGRGDFLTDLAEGRISAEDAPAQARVLGFKPGGGPLLPVVMRLGDTLSPQGGGWAVLARAVGEELSSLGVPVLLGVRPVEGRVPLLLALRAESDRPSVADRVAAALRAGVERAGMLRPGGRPPVVVVGPAGDWAAVPTGLRHAVETATAAQGLPERPWYDARRLDIDLLLWRLRDHPDLADFVRRAIGPVLDHDRRSRPALLPTLETYLAHAGRKAETARELHLNRQTLYNRLARIEELLGVDLDDPQTVLTLSLALRARRHVP
ncbi:MULTISPECIES: PucR family transcriptional regulator [Streptomyces]|uniref:PucR family transcriptional regulator n=2 Tax=Streptomyces TaxID=1883 RepID=A0ABU3JEJ6_9ACTN|nr:PucR family transcriptional regulator [Streptomyces sp. McG7]MBT2902535.1 PucR family transcriptional regulator [Streptomyces sp. McG8]MDQ0486813.1 purine catabolism regulator [Streptomyces thermodiastaticus]MDT6973472.1 PucR family transcriptional regulator [Streptomyces thermocarboxydus]MXQ60105.1 PucR family transcriptional regulator [Streptomyces sp. XHT-2]MYW52195.1 PucR family transcriptional regulator [Streptomyces sp. SID8376]WSB40651.1 PucR family transcriptional regulator [Strept